MSHRQLRRLGTCAAVMAGAGASAAVLWGVSWVAAVLAVIAIACLAAAVYAWLAARRVSRVLAGGLIDERDPRR